MVSVISAPVEFVKRFAHMLDALWFTKTIVFDPTLTTLMLATEQL